MNSRQKRLREEQNKRKREVLFSSIWIMVAFIGTVGGLIVTVNGRGAFRIGPDDGRERGEIQAQLAELRKEREDVRLSLMESREMQQTFLQAAHQKGSILYKESLSPENRAQIDKIASAQDDLSKQLARLNDAILQTPEKAVAIPVLKQQVTDLQEKYRGDNEAMHAEIGRLYTMMSIFFGSMVALIVGVGGLFFSVFKHRADRSLRRETDDTNPPSPVQTAVPIASQEAVVPEVGKTTEGASRQAGGTEA
jgi:hypothetical protein